jgi:hypothetical protein
MHNKLIALGFFFLGHQAMAQNLLECDTTLPMYKTDCRLNSIPLTQANKFEENFDAIYTITLDSNCGSSNKNFPVYFTVGGQQGTPTNVYLGKTGQVFTAQGSGALSMSDAKPNLTKISRLPVSCDITLQSITFRPSGPVIDAWMANGAAAANAINLNARVFESKSEIMTYFEMYIGSEGSDKEEAQSILQVIKGQLPEGDPNIEIINSILANASAADINKAYEGFVAKLKEQVQIGKSIQEKLVYAKGQEDVVLKSAIQKGVTILESLGEQA